MGSVNRFHFWQKLILTAAAPMRVTTFTSQRTQESGSGFQGLSPNQWSWRAAPGTVPPRTLVTGDVQRSVSAWSRGEKDSHSCVVTSSYGAGSRPEVRVADFHARSVAASYAPVKLQGSETVVVAGPSVAARKQAIEASCAAKLQSSHSIPSFCIGGPPRRTVSVDVSTRRDALMSAGLPQAASFVAAPLRAWDSATSAKGSQATSFVAAPLRAWDSGAKGSQATSQPSSPSTVNPYLQRSKSEKSGALVVAKPLGTWPTVQATPVSARRPETLHPALVHGIDVGRRNAAAIGHQVPQLDDELLSAAPAKEALTVPADTGASGQGVARLWPPRPRRIEVEASTTEAPSVAARSQPGSTREQSEQQDAAKPYPSQRRVSTGLVFNPGLSTVERHEELDEPTAPVGSQQRNAPRRALDEVTNHLSPRSAVLKSQKPPAASLSDVDLFSRFLQSESAVVTRESFELLMSRTSPAWQQDSEWPFRQVQRGAAINGRSAGRVWDLLSKRADLPEYSAAPLQGSRVVVCGAGPCGLRAALELALLCAEVTIIEKRPEEEAFIRINRVHLWEWCKQDLISWGAKVFDPPGPTFGSDGDVCHIGIGELQLLLFKSALLLGVKIRYGTEVLKVEENMLICSDDVQLQCDALIVANGTGGSSHLSQRLGLRSIVAGSKNSAIGVVANFVNKREPNEMNLRQFSWARQFNPKLFSHLEATSQINLENVVYYKATAHHYMVMTPTKRSLLEKGVLLDGRFASDLLHRSNVDTEELFAMVKEVAAFFNLPTELCKSQGAMIFDFSGVKRLESAATFSDDIFICAVGDALLEPFWPEGLGIMRGFMSALDAVSAVTLAVSGKREEAMTQISATYNILKSVAAQTASTCLHRDIRQYSLQPKSRYILGH